MSLIRDKQTTHRTLNWTWHVICGQYIFNSLISQGPAKPTSISTSRVLTRVHCLYTSWVRSNWRKTVSSLTSVQLEGNTGEGQDSTRKSAQHAADSAPRVLAHLCSWGWHEQTQHQGSWAHLCSWGFTLWLQKVSILLQPRKKLY